MENQGGNTTRTRRTLTPEQKRRILEKRRKARMKKRLMIIVPAAVVLLALIIVLIVVLGGGESADTSLESIQPSLEMEIQQADGEDISEAEGDPAEEGDVLILDGEADGMDAALTPEGGDALAVDPSAAPAVTAQPGAVTGAFDYDAAYRQAALGQTTGPELTYDYYDGSIATDKLTRWSEAKQGYIPILFKAETDEKIIAITVDDCFQGNNLMQIVQCAESNNADLTIFPISKNLELDSVATALRYAYQCGFEIGNHTYNHAGMYHYDQERMQQEIWYQQMKVNEVLGVNYTQNFFRPKGGDEREDQRVHAYLNQLGYKGVAIWTQSGSTDSLDSLYNNLAPGRIYLFHTTNNDLNKLLDFIPGAVARGYRLVTMSEMFGLADPQVSDLTLTMDTKPPKLEAFNIKIPTLKKTSYIRAAAVVQKRLVELGWLEGEADGVYGQSSFVAIGLFQMEAGIKATGKADAATQKLLFSNDAPVATPEKIAALYKQLGKSAP